jgi:predicted SAM-dependent methyltransferase
MRRRLGRELRLLRRRLAGTDSRLIAAYRREAQCPKLQIGGGWRRLDGWLNSDIELAPDILYMDAAKPFPLPDSAFRFVFTEHMIEHIEYDQAQAMLRECHRVLATGGVIRVVTPNLNVVAAIGAECRSEIQQAYVDYFLQHFIPDGQPPTRAAIANAFFRSWGHRFIYDEPTLRLLLEAAGFTDIVRRRLGESDHSELSGIEHESRYPPGMLDFESLALEATKCA